MSELLRNLFASEPFIPHGHCYLWKPGLVWLHILSDSLIALAYYSIPLALIYFVSKRRDLPFNELFILLGAFIIACGTTHIMEVWTLWHPNYWVSGVLKAITAIVSLYAAFEFISLLPQAIALPSLAATNKKLEHEIVERKLAEESQKRYAQRVEGINIISRATSAQQSSKETAIVALSHLHRLVPYQWATIALFDFEKSQAKIIAEDTNGDSVFPEGTLLPLEYFSTPKDADNNASYQIEDIATLEEPSLLMQRLLAAGFRCCIVVPLFNQGKLIGELKLAETSASAFNGEHEEIASEVATVLAITIQKDLILEQSQGDRDRLQTLSTRLLVAQETERRHLARELHDEIGQALTAVKINLQAVQRSSPTSASTVPIQESVNIVEVALKQVRNLSLDLRPSLLDDLGLVAALRWYVDRYTQRTGIRTELSATSYQTQLSSSIETACFRIIQEALTNAARHAKPQKVTISLQQQDEKLYLVIRDNGVGFNVQMARQRATRGGSLGLLGMEERTLLAGGRFTIKSAPSQGTEISACFPLLTESANEFADLGTSV